MAHMATTLTVDKAGRIILPKPLRDQLQLAPGDSLELKHTDSQIVLRPIRKQAPVRKKHGIWVLSANGHRTTVEDVNEVIRQVREERIEHNLGPSR
jgi:AbrB family looped-hinge helix DNA binding protein